MTSRIRLGFENLLACLLDALKSVEDRLGSYLFSLVKLAVPMNPCDDLEFTQVTVKIPVVCAIAGSTP